MRMRPSASSKSDGHQVLAAFAAVEREHGDACALAAGEVGEHAAVFVVGVGDDEHEGGAGAELAEELLEGGRAVIDGQSVGEVLWGDALAGEVGGIVERRDLRGERKGRRERSEHEAGAMQSQRDSRKHSMVGGTSRMAAEIWLKRSTDIAC